MAPSATKGGGRVEGRVVGVPTVLQERTGRLRRLAPLVLLALLVIGVASEPALAAPFIVLGVIVIAPLLVTGWLFGRGVGRGLGRAVLHAASRGAGHRADLGYRDALVFRVQDATDQQHEVILRGRAEGVSHGDEVAVAGLRFAGRLHAVRVVNRKTGRALHSMVPILRTAAALAALIAVFIVVAVMISA